MRFRFAYSLLFFFVSASGFGQVLPDSLGLTGMMTDTVVGDRLVGEVKALMKEKKWDAAEAKGEQARLVYERTVGEESRQVGDVWQRIGGIRYYQKDYEKAVQYLEKSLAIRLNFFGSKHIIVANSYNSLGVVYEEKSEHDKAIDCHQKALEIRLKILGEKHLDVAMSYSNLGTSYRSKNEHNKAISCHQKALDICIQVSGLENTNAATCYSNLGNSYWGKSEYLKAIDSYQRGLAIQLKLLGTEHVDVAASYNGLGNSYCDMTEYDKAINCYQKTLAIRLKTLGPKHPSVAGAYNNLGNCYELKAEHNQAIVYYQKALDIRLQTLGPEHPNVAMSYNNLGVSYGSTMEFSKAIECHQKALRIRLNVLGPEHLDVAASYNNLGICYNKSEDYNEAIRYYQKSLDINLKVRGTKNPFVAICYNNLARCHAAQGDYGNAIKQSKQALLACQYNYLDFSQVNSLKESLGALADLSWMLQNQYRQSHTAELIAQSDSYALQAFAAIDYLQSTFTEEGTKSFWLSQNYPIYEHAINISLLRASVDRNDTLRRNTFTYAEKSKSALLQAGLKESGARSFAGIPDSLLQREHDLRIDITWREKQRQALLDKGLAETDTSVLRVANIVFDLRRQYDVFKDSLEARYPDYYRLKYDLSTTSLTYVQDTLLQPGQTLLEYFVGDSSVYLFTVRRDTFTVTEIKKDPSFPLETWVKQLRHGLTDYHASHSQSPTYSNRTAQEYVDAACQLYQKLIAPVAGLLTDTLIIVPDGVLGYVPFDVLLTTRPTRPSRFHNHAYLGEKKRISYAYSATLLREMRDKQHKTQPTESLLALAPFFRGNVKQLMEQVDTLSELLALRTRDTLGALPASGREALVVAKIFKGKARFGGDAAKERLEQEAGRYRILHLSTHGQADDKVGDYAYLGFAVPGDSSAFDKFFAKDIYNLSLNADLVTLSACETGIGELKRGEGIISLARAFAYAGAKSIVTTLWSVNDTRTSELMEHFYQNLYQGMDKDTALWQTKRDYLKAHASDPEATHPYFWAGFIPIGDMRPIAR